MHFAALRSPAALIIFSLLATAPHALAQEQQRAAVLEFEIAPGVKPLDRAWLSDRTRAALQEATPFLVMTGEATDALLRSNGQALADCSSDCELMAGRILGAAYLASGRVTQSGSRISVTMRLFSVGDGQLISSAEARGESLERIKETMDGALKTLVAPLANKLAGEATAAEPPADGAQPANAAQPDAPATTDAPAKIEANASFAAPGKNRIEPKSGLEFVYIPAGTVHIGCEPKDTQCEPAEKPGRDISMEAFSLGKTAVTLGAYQKCLQAGGCSQPNSGGACTWGTSKKNSPINCVDWSQANDFCSWMGARLPTAEAWEMAAKGGESRIYPWGNQPPTDKRARYSGTDGPAAVGTFPDGESKQGLEDMAGNVWQWTANDDKSGKRELHGGSWIGKPRALRASAKLRLEADAKDDSVGFRCGM